MLRCVVRAFGPAVDVVATECYDPPRPGPGEVSVRMLLASVNPSDLVTISGAYASRTTLPFVPGFEGVGVVEATGAGVSEVAAGQRVLPLGTAGAWQQVKVAEARWCLPVLPRLTDEQAATSYVNPLTALLMSRQYVIPGGGAGTAGAAGVVVNAAASAIGRMAIRMLNRAGVEPVALVRHPRGREQLTGLRTAAVLCTSDDGVREALPAVVREAAGGRPPTVVLDAVGGSEGGDLARALAPGGTLVHYGLLSGRPLPPALATERPDVRVVLFRLRDWVHTADRARLTDALAEAQHLVADGTAATPVAHVLPLRDVREALRREAVPGRTGKVLLRAD
ncbi:alcohol dehydrogenase [Streptomyces eurocidicus]|uniref:Alcohol dehydrogenase n=1 Tax=Streptomyces eurocidicus TaxID=66423 RepID=A0A2N8NVJ1_STREU|nr:zinc-dependent alcohol dehydrogenase family protein [Streptomyces eurocidicus]MBB5122283.1 NADPH:quinone reductase-like Zn-dependent oxidoreductase [Streptomyces eurocidicus]PNE32800.1 alcohol dehydrogenase [Streptomyces eurocidicus]